MAKWIPIESRPMTDEERSEWSETHGYDVEYDDAVIYTSQLPDDGQGVLTCSQYGNVMSDTFYNDIDYGCYFEENGDMDGIIAWMPLPKPPLNLLKKYCDAKMNLKDDENGKHYSNKY